jgi:hypothetical protein
MDDCGVDEPYQWWNDTIGVGPDLPSISGFKVAMTPVAICSVLPQRMTGRGEDMLGVLV